MPSSKNRRRIEVSTHAYNRLKQMADAEERTVTSVANELIHGSLQTYQPTWIPKAYMDRFDGHARGVLVLAKEEALALNHTWIGTEHLLLGLIREEEGIAAQVLRRLWIERDKVRESVEYIIGSQDHPPAEEIEYAPRVRKVLAFAVDEAQTLGHDHVGTEHLLLGLVRESEGIAAHILNSYGVIGKVRERTLRCLRDADAGDAAGQHEQTQVVRP
jgi:ATP-dependent Clp protease ATP-binding subunit ClpC